MRRRSVFVAASLAGAGLAAVGFLGAGLGHGVVNGGASPSASANTSLPQPGQLDGEAQGDAQPTLATVPASAKRTSSAQASRATHGTVPTKTSASASTLGPTQQSSPPPSSTPTTNTNGVIRAGDSKAHCIALNLYEGVLTQSILAEVSNATGITYNCVSGFANPSATWDVWETPWMFSTVGDNWDSWLKNPAHAAVMSVDLIPQTLQNNGNPLSWEQPCAAGDYNKYATILARNLVSYGAGGVAIRLGPEANGDWEADFVGTTSAEMAAFAKCFDNEVSAMRAVSGAHFLFIWNPNVCTADIPISQWYPGDS